MELIDKKSWYKKKRYIIPVIALSLILFFGSNNGSSPQVKSESIPIPSYGSNVPLYESTNTVNLNTNSFSPTPSSALSNDNYYTNVNGNSVHSPAYSNSVPQGASARCGDGTYSYSQHRSGTCSHHGGVSEWL
ncbi:MAG: DUF3761 domain-containing protein [Patescibacteria group bacterium]